MARTTHHRRNVVAMYRPTLFLLEDRLSLGDGVLLVYYGNQQQLEYDFVVSPGVTPFPVPSPA